MRLHYSCTALYVKLDVALHWMLLLRQV